jgi:hypothetical protein
VVLVLCRFAVDCGGCGCAIRSQTGQGTSPHADSRGGAAGCLGAEQWRQLRCSKLRRPHRLRARACHLQAPHHLSATPLASSNHGRPAAWQHTQHGVRAMTDTTSGHNDQRRCCCYCRSGSSGTGTTRPCALLLTLRCFMALRSMLRRGITATSSLFGSPTAASRCAVGFRRQIQRLVLGQRHIPRRGVLHSRQDAKLLRAATSSMCRWH